MMIKKYTYLLFMVCCVYGQNYLDLPKGSKCSRFGMDGVCASVYNCLTAAEDIKEKDYPSICTYHGKEPIICCTDCDLVNDTRTMYIDPTSGRWHFRNGQKARDKCFDYMEQLQPCHGHFTGTIFKEKHPMKYCFRPYPTAVGAAGGVDAKRNEFPHMALLGYGEDTESAQWLCGGTLISENYILTAAHCISTTKLGEVRFIALGILKRTDPQELWQHYNVKRIIAHPLYKPPSKYHDIALLETVGSVTFNMQVMPACLHYELVERDKDAQATGWGALGKRMGLADTLQAVRLEEFTEKECSDLYPQHRHLKNGYDHNTQMCYGHRQEIKDTCEGDSGGPLQNREHINHCQFVVIGVTSAGRECGNVGSTGLYTRVRHYLHWIEDIVWP